MLHPTLALMVSQLLADMAAHQNVTRTSWLFECGHSARTISRHIARGELVRLCRGWVATLEASQLSVLAVAHYGQLTGPTALHSLGLWDAADTRLHIRVPPNAHGSNRLLAVPLAEFVAPRTRPGALVKHWMPAGPRHAFDPPWRASVLDALALTSRIAPPEQFIASTESALHARAFSHAGLPMLAARVSRSARKSLRLVDAASGSGLETLTRLRLAPLVSSIETQVGLPGIGPSGRHGFVDVLINGWLVIEVDGDEFHDEGADRRRNAALVRLGYRWHRFGYDQVMYGWPDVEATVVELLRYPTQAGFRRSFAQ